MEFMIDLGKGFLLGNCVLLVLTVLEHLYKRQQRIKQVLVQQDLIHKMELKAGISVQRGQPFWKSSIGVSTKDKRR